MKLVLDASMALAWLFERKNETEIHCAERALSTIADVETWVPMLWHTEIINALLIGERRRAVTEAQVIDYLQKLYGLPIITDDTTPANRRDLIMALAREHELTAYDATYLELALRTDATLATFDAKLANAMQNAGGLIFN
jgi:predicted nucleic acid-binding protein